MEIARFNKRALSYLIDFLLTFGIGVALSIPLFIYTEIPWYFSIILLMIICYLTYLLIHVTTMLLSRGRTLGAAIFGIKTVTKDNKPISGRNVWIKELYLGLLPFVIANAIYMLIIHTEQTLFDRITNSIVVDVRYST
ncbi:MAG: RDD family protein, partial [Bacilli bacterium]|nr:RDD family protein [Bacilli bacterium]